MKNSCKLQCNDIILALFMKFYLGGIWMHDGNGNEMESQGYGGFDYPPRGNGVPIPNNQIAYPKTITWD